jgi:hypothetical protein
MLQSQQCCHTLTWVCLLGLLLLLLLVVLPSALLLLLLLLLLLVPLLLLLLVLLLLPTSISRATCHACSPCRLPLVAPPARRKATCRPQEQHKDLQSNAWNALRHSTKNANTCCWLCGKDMLGHPNVILIEKIERKD